MRIVHRLVDDRVKAREWLDGAERTDAKGHPRRKFLKGSEEKDARKALARLVLTGELDEKLRRSLAKCIDPRIFGGKDFIGSGAQAEHTATFKIVRRRTGDHVYRGHVLAYLAQRVNEQRGSLSRALDAAECEFGLSRRTLEEEYWAPVSPFLRKLLPVLKQLKEPPMEEPCPACGAAIPVPQHARQSGRCRKEPHGSDKSKLTSSVFPCGHHGPLGRMT